MTLYPLTFQPIFKERVWGGRNLERLYRKQLPPNVPIGESWEISDRPDDISVIANGPLAGKSLRWLMENHQRDLLGDAPAQGGRFPLLIKILDAEETLSLQVHPPAKQAAELGGEPKTEMWHITHAGPAAELFVGLKNGITRDEFERKIRTGQVAECFHRVHVKEGDTMFLPSGRVHALGAGLVLFEIQQNSDTTYRVFDWNRVGLDGKPRDLHVAQSLASIDFDDFQPDLINSQPVEVGPASVQPLVNDVFKVDLVQTPVATSIALRQSHFKIVCVVAGKVRVTDETSAPVELAPGRFCLVPASLRRAELWAEAGSRYLFVQPGT